jgi:hypothetical protein
MKGHVVVDHEFVSIPATSTPGNLSSAMHALRFCEFDHHYDFV